MREEFAGAVGVFVGCTSGVLVSSWLSDFDSDEQHNLLKQQIKQILTNIKGIIKSVRIMSIAHCSAAIFSLVFSCDSNSTLYSGLSLTN